MRTRPASPSAKVHGSQEPPTTVCQLALDHAPMDRCGDLMIRHAAPNAKLQESRITRTVLPSARFHAVMDNGGAVKAASAYPLAMLQRRLLLKMAFNTANNHANLANGGETKTRAVNLNATAHGSQELPATVYQPALDHAPTDRCGDLMIKHAVLSARPQELRTLRTVLPFVKLHARLVFGGKKKITAATLFATIHGFQLLRMVYQNAASHAAHAKSLTLTPINAKTLAIILGSTILCMMYQFARDHALVTCSGDLMTRLAFQFVKLQE